MVSAIFKFKKSQLPLKPTFEMLAGIAIILLFIYVGKSYATGEIFQKIRITIDSAATIDILSAMPDNARSFNLEVPSKFLVSFDPTLVRIESFENDPSASMRFFVGMSGIKINKQFSNPRSIIFEKSDDNIEVKNTSTTAMVKQRCPSVTIDDSDKSYIAVTPNTNEFATRVIVPVLSLSHYTEAIEGYNMKENTKILLEISTINTDTFRAYYKPNLKSRKIACTIVNNLLDKNPGLKFEIIPSEKSLPDKPGMQVFLEFNASIQNLARDAITRALK